MRDPHPTPLARSWTVAALTLLAVVALAPGPARAACGRYGVPGSWVSAGAALFDSLAEAGALAERPNSPAPAPRPCSGALCSGNPAPPLAPTTIEPRTVESWAWLADEPAPAPIDSRPRIIDEFVGLPTTSPPSIFHPPRRPLPTS
jgi:hypothetical protein